MTRSSYYYLTRAENENLATNGAAMLAAAGVCGGAATAGRPVNLIELGAGDGTKTVTLLNAIRDGGSGKDCGGGASPVTYVPIDISWGAMRSLYAAVEGTTGGLSPVRVHGYVADYFDALDTLRDAEWTHGLGGSASDNSPGATLPHNVVVYLGSTVGNVTGAELVSFLAAIRARLNDGDHLLLGYDLLQTPAKHLATYPADRTVGDLFEAILDRMRRELDADISDGALDVEVVFDEADGAVLGRFVSTRDHVLAVGRGARRRDFPLRSGERIHVLLCRKFKRDGMAAAASEAGFELQQTWTDATGRFADSLFRAVWAGPADVLPSPQFWPIRSRTTVQNRCGALLYFRILILWGLTSLQDETSTLCSLTCSFWWCSLRSSCFSPCHVALLLLSSQFWPMWSKSRRGLGQLPIGQSTLSGWVDGWDAVSHCWSPLLTSTGSAKIGKTAISVQEQMSGTFDLDGEPCTKSLSQGQSAWIGRLLLNQAALEDSTFECL